MKSAGIIQVVQVLTFSSAIAISSLAQGTVTLIGPTIRNGSFEDGVLLPWTTTAGSATVAQESGFAAHGLWYAVLSDAANASIVRPSIFQRPPADATNGLVFWIAFDARNGAASFEGIRVFFSAQNGDGTTVFTTNTFFTMTLVEWERFHAGFQVPSAWDGGQVSLGLQFENFDASAGSTYTGYFDNVVLQQIPEQSAIALFLLSASFLGWRWHRARRR